VRTFRLSGALLDRGPGFRRSVLELVALANSAYNRSHRRFCANLLMISKFCLHVNLPLSSLFPHPRPPKPVVGGYSSNANLVWPTEEPPVRRIAQRKLSKSDQTKSPEPLGLAGVRLLGHAMACSLRDSLQGLRGCTTTHVTPTQRTSFPLPSTGRPNGHREAPLLLTAL